MSQQNIINFMADKTSISVSKWNDGSPIYNDVKAFLPNPSISKSIDDPNDPTKKIVVSGISGMIDVYSVFKTAKGGGKRRRKAKSVKRKKSKTRKTGGQKRSRSRKGKK